jgi:hypothetical protein
MAPPPPENQRACSAVAVVIGTHKYSTLDGHQRHDVFQVGTCGPVGGAQEKRVNLVVVPRCPEDPMPHQRHGLSEEVRVAFLLDTPRQYLGANIKRAATRTCVMPNVRNVW